MKDGSYLNLLDLGRPWVFVLLPLLLWVLYRVLPSGVKAEVCPWTFLLPPEENRAGRTGERPDLFALLFWFLAVCSLLFVLAGPVWRPWVTLRVKDEALFRALAGNDREEHMARIKSRMGDRVRLKVLYGESPVGEHFIPEIVTGYLDDGKGDAFVPLPLPKGDTVSLVKARRLGGNEVAIVEAGLGHLRVGVEQTTNESEYIHLQTLEDDAFVANNGATLKLAKLRPLKLDSELALPPGFQKAVENCLTEGDAPLTVTDDFARYSSARGPVILVLNKTRKMPFLFTPPSPEAPYRISALSSLANPTRHLFSDIAVKRLPLHLTEKDGLPLMVHSGRPVALLREEGERMVLLLGFYPEDLKLGERDMTSLVRTLLATLKLDAVYRSDWIQNAPPPGARDPERGLQDIDKFVRNRYAAFPAGLALFLSVLFALLARMRRRGLKP